MDENNRKYKELMSAFDEDVEQGERTEACAKELDTAIHEGTTESIAKCDDKFQFHLGLKHDTVDNVNEKDEQFYQSSIRRGGIPRCTVSDEEEDQDEHKVASVSTRVVQMVRILANEPNKSEWVLSKLVEFIVLGKVLIFVASKDNCAALAKELEQKGFTVGVIHDEIHQVNRTQIINEFERDTPILITTDAAARGLDIPSIRSVVNYDVAPDIDTHKYRIRRTGRGDKAGIAYTLLTPLDKEFAPYLVTSLQNTKQVVSQDLLNMAMQNSHFANTRSRHGDGGGRHFALGNRVQRERPGFGSDSGLSHSTSRTTVDSSNPFDYNGPSTKTTTTVGPMTDWRGGSTASSGMSGTNQTSAMEAASQSQFKSSSVATTDTGLECQSAAVPSSVSQKRTGQTTQEDPTSTTKRSRFND